MLQLIGCVRLSAFTLSSLTYYWPKPCSICMRHSLHTKQTSFSCCFTGSHMFWCSLISHSDELLILAIYFMFCSFSQTVNTFISHPIGSVYALLLILKISFRRDRYFTFWFDSIFRQSTASTSDGIHTVYYT